MSLRWRADGRLLCAAKCEALPGDVYIGDDEHYQWAVLDKIIVPAANEDTTGLWHLAFEELE